MLARNAHLLGKVFLLPTGLVPQFFEDVTKRWHNTYI
jgi:hypothetical protein